MTDWAQFWPVDLHVHTPGSSDAKLEAFGTPQDIVEEALRAGLAAIAITDHNTADWCDRISTAATSTPLVVLPGVEISTTEGHLLAIWEEGTSSTVINELLVLLGIKQEDRGKLDISANVGFAIAAQHISDCGGLAIAAHVDKQKGLLGLTVKAHLISTLLEGSLSAVEIVKMETAEVIQEKVDGKRILACIRASDTWDHATSAHGLSGIGVRRTWIKAGRPDLIGVRHALADPDLRVRLIEPPQDLDYPMLESIEIVGGFLNGQKISFCPDLNCLLGGTGAGKSLILEAVRYAMGQQLDRASFPSLWSEVQSRLDSALTTSGVVKLQLRSGGHRYRIEREYSRDGSIAPTVRQQLDDDWVDVDVHTRDFAKLAAFSQGEILEYSRQPVGRMTLIDTGIDLTTQTSAIKEATIALRTNASKLIDARQRVAELRASAAKESEVAEQLRLLSDFFDSSVVKQQEGWQRDRTRLSRTSKGVSSLSIPAIKVPKLGTSAEIKENETIFGDIEKLLETLEESVRTNISRIESSISTAKESIASLSSQSDQNFEAFTEKLDTELESVNPGSSLKLLRERLAELQARLLDIQSERDELEKEAQPALDAVAKLRESLIKELSKARHDRRNIRRERVESLNDKTAGFVKLDIPSSGDFGDFRAALDRLKVGSRVKEDVLDSIAHTVHPLRFARAMWNFNATEIIDDKSGIDASSVSRLLANIDDKDLWHDLLELQIIDRPDILTVKFRKPDDGSYVSIEQLAHGQRCTAILVILLADGDTIVLVDQPEDALHAPWIEEYLVDRLRELRGTRQYIFATRSPGIVVSGDAEQIITMMATAGHGEVEAFGSLERHDLNRLTLHHLEGGPVAFNRRSRKLKASTTTN